MHFVQLGLGGVISHTMVDVPHDGSRWSTSPAPAVTLYHRNGGELLASTAASTGGSWPCSSSVAGSNTIVMGSTTGVKRWEEYVIGPNASGQWEWVTVDAFTSSSLTTLDPLVNSYSTGTVKSHTLTFTVSTTEAASVELNCFASWRYTVDGRERKESSVFNISRYAPRMTLTPAEVLQAEPRARKVLGSNQKIGIVLKRIWENKVLPDVAKLLGSAGAMVSGEAVEEAHLLKFEEMVSRKSKDFEAAKEYAELYVQQLDEIRLSVVDLDESGGQADDETPRGARTPRLLRG